MGELVNQFANIFNTGGGSDTVLWFTVLTVTVIIYICAYVRRLFGTVCAAAVCLILSFSDLGLAYQAAAFAFINSVIILYESRKTE